MSFHLILTYTHIVNVLPPLYHSAIGILRTTKKSVNVIHAHSLNRGSSKTYPIRINNNVHADMYDARYINAAKYIPWDAYCTLLLWIGWKLARFLFTKTSVNKLLNYVMQYFLWMYYEQNMPTHISPAWSITAAKLLLFFDIHKKIGIILPIYLILCVITAKIEIAIAVAIAISSLC